MYNDKSKSNAKNSSHSNHLMFKKNYHLYLKHQMYLQSYTMQSLGDKVGCTKECIRQIMEGLCFPEIIQKICHVLKVDLKYIMGNVLGNSVENRGSFVIEKPTYHYLWKTIEICKVFNCNKHSVLKLFKNGELPYINVGGASLIEPRVKQEDLLEYLET
jgi:hypothetical protein